MTYGNVTTTPKKKSLELMNWSQMRQTAALMLVRTLGNFSENVHLHGRRSCRVIFGVGVGDRCDMLHHNTSSPREMTSNMIISLSPVRQSIIAYIAMIKEYDLHTHHKFHPGAHILVDRVSYLQNGGQAPKTISSASSCLSFASLLKSSQGISSLHNSS